MKLAYKLMPFVVAMQVIGACVELSQCRWIPSVGFLVAGGISFLVVCDGDRQ